LFLTPDDFRFETGLLPFVHDWMDYNVSCQDVLVKQERLRRDHRHCIIDDKSLKPEIKHALFMIYPSGIFDALLVCWGN
jgi:hypothetical protein